MYEKRQKKICKISIFVGSSSLWITVLRWWEQQLILKKKQKRKRKESSQKVLVDM